MKYSLIFKELNIEDYERVIEVRCSEVRLHAIIAIHQTAVGPALGGVRASVYSSFEDACTDALRLAKGMTYKALISGTDTGGGKSVIILPQDLPYLTEDMLRAFGQAVDALEGKYICAEDLGVSIKDISIIAQETPYVCGIADISGDPSIYTAHGGFLCIKETAEYLWGSPSLQGKKIAIQGIGSVGRRLLHSCFFEGAELYISDILETVLLDAVQLYGAKIVPTEDIHALECDIFTPCARGNVIRKDNVADLRCKAIVGLANNQLQDSSIGVMLHERGILYAPDYLVNAGGLLNVTAAIEGKIYEPKEVLNKVANLPIVLRQLYNQSKITGKDLVALSDSFVEDKLLAYTS
ncbi:Leucine dehydrogenase,Glutamate/Leucine/Phenylalanine/Valine dehydrogenase [Chlamydia serpentis]|uniref:Leucine dehydrogenase,Glutamate/Leucine/Phenylalanine/Valine dehydrogenase n=1 Tax=Chlamydia serpentis TaxID=1967782 RepID=A0A2R8FC80_9CHLA|nr:Glu/Leu/Phe/Val dehydrogenase [Chlamydia serpentis]SPN74029.1 Leucine dehydrogenase,Glutamate/Leucine/Phenylalanine/Valine dehydrogenase [Chlamydia serpentis]